MPRGYDQPLYVLPFDHRGSFETKMFGWEGDLTPEQTAQVMAYVLSVSKYPAGSAALPDKMDDLKTISIDAPK